MAKAILMVWSCLVGFAVLALAAPSPQKTRPHIVLILADDMGYGDLSCYNPEGKIPTPHIDRLAAEGTRFTDAHSGGSSCIPSRYALITGRFAVRKSMSLAKGGLIEAGRMTTASLLRDHGYRTAMVGKWHLGFDQPMKGKAGAVDYSKPLREGPVDCGFDSFFGMHASLDIPPYFFIRDRTPVRPPTEDIAANDNVGGPEDWNKIQGAFWRAGKVAPDFKLEEVTPRFFREAVGVIREHAEQRANRPLFLYLALPSPHTPWLPTEAFQGRSGAGMYGDFVMQVDAGVGRVMTALKSAGMAENTLFLFSSDNGPVWYDKDIERFGHRSCAELRGMKFASWEGGHRMPFIARWPGKTAPGSTCGQTVVFSDVLGTFAGIVGLNKIPAGMAEDSVSFLPYLLDASKAPKRRPPILHNGSTIRDGDWKLILPKGRSKMKEYPDGQLYNLRADISERHNLVLERPETVERLKKQLSAIVAK